MARIKRIFRGYANIRKYSDACVQNSKTDIREISVIRSLINYFTVNQLHKKKSSKKCVLSAFIPLILHAKCEALNGV